MKNKAFFRVFNFIFASILSAVLEIRSHKLRSFLSMLGVTIGIAAFVTSKSLGEMSEKFVKEVIADAGGMNRINIVAKKPLDDREAYEFARSPGLRLSDLDSLKKKVPGIQAISKLDYKYELHFYIKDEDYQIGIIGVNKDLIGKIRVHYGREITDQEYERGDGVCMMTRNLMDRIKKNNDMTPDQIVGKRLYISEGVALLIIGIFDKAYPDHYIYRNSLFVPIKFYEKNVSGLNAVQGNLRLRLSAPDLDSSVSKEVARTLQSLHRGVKDFEFEPSNMASEFDESAKKVSLTFVIITVLALLVGGLNIMNVMMVSISARVREIGMRKAVGATRLQIFLQFIIEASVLSVAGGLVGIFIGAIGALVVTQMVAQTIGAAPMAVNQGIFVMGAVVALLEGTLFGLLPAVKAFRMSPVMALHYE